MKKTLLLFFTFWIIPQLALFAQGFSLSGNMVSLSGNAGQEISPTINIHNTSGQPMEIRWDFQSSTAPNGWEFIICDRQCYTSTKGLKSFYLAPGETLTNFRVSFRPNGIKGEGSITLRFYNPLERNNDQYVIFNANTQVKSSSMEQLNNHSTPRIYPNPATDYILLSSGGNDIKFLELYNVMGTKIASFTVQYEGEKFSVDNLPKGMYMVRMLDAQHRVVRTQNLNKYNP